MSVPKQALDILKRLCADSFQPTHPVRIGAEVEWLVFNPDDLTAPVTVATTTAVAAGPLPSEGVVTVEPGGQLELSTKPCPAPSLLLESLAADVAVLTDRFQQAGLALVTLGLDPVRPPVRTLDAPRYRGMDAFFAHRSPTGLRMMTLTASLQLNIDFGAQPNTTWARACMLAPALLAAFANSPTSDGTTFSAASARQKIWDQTDPSRTRPVAPHPDAWLDYALNAQVMLRRDAGRLQPQLDDLTLGQWLATDTPPDEAAMADHLTTLFPPLRPRGFLELRLLDTLPPVGRAAAIATVWCLLTDEQAGKQAEAELARHGPLWELAVQHGVAHPAVSTAARDCLAIAAGALTEPQLVSACRQWLEHLDRPAAPVPIEQLIASLIEA